MIEVYGKYGTSEYDAALQIKELFEKAVPGIVNNPNDHVAIIAGAMCHGQRVRDIDLLVLAHFDSRVIFAPFLPLPKPWKPSETIRPSAVAIESFCLVIEVKDHYASQVKFDGTGVTVTYRHSEHDVSEQNRQQMHSLRNYLAIHHIESPYITRLIWLRHLHNTDLPPRPHRIIAGNLTWEMLLNVIAQVDSPSLFDWKTWRMSSRNLSKQLVRQVVRLFTKELIPTNLDRRRMEQINGRLITEQHLHEKVVGSEMLLLRGRGGTGKTIRLLQMAKHLYEQQAARILILTYNKALVADLRRILTIMGVVDKAAQRGIRIQTVHSFFYHILKNLEVIAEDENSFLEKYGELKSETLELLDVGALSEEDIQKVKNSRQADFLWDYVFIDEAQDWPDDERKILLKIYPYSQFSIADGVDQLIRSMEPVNWRTDLSSSQVNVISLRKCLRMKAGLTRFVSAFADNLQLPASEWRANEEVPGGKVMILDGVDILARKDIFESLLASNDKAGNKPVDMLFNIPPNLSSSYTDTNVPYVLQKWGYPIWDGTDRDIRNTYATDNDQLRIVQYESCRGLEGWIVVNFELDRFYDYKFDRLKSWQMSDPYASSIDNQIVELLAARWLLIPLTRAMDTLVIHLADRHSKIRQALRAAAEQYADYVEWITE